MNNERGLQIEVRSCLDNEISLVDIRNDIKKGAWQKKANWFETLASIFICIRTNIAPNEFCCHMLFALLQSRYFIFIVLIF